MRQTTDGQCGDDEAVVRRVVKDVTGQRADSVQQLGRTSLGNEVVRKEGDRNAGAAGTGTGNSFNDDRLNG